VRADLVLEGGGAKGVALAGAVAGLASGGVEPRRIAGTSAGAIVAALLAAGLPPAEVDALARDLEITDLVPIRRLTALGAVGRGLSVLFETGTHDHRPLRAWLRERLGGLGVETFGDLRLDDPGSSLPDHPWRLVTAVTDLSRRRRILLPWDLPDYGLDPDAFPVADAVAASAAIPLVFEPARLRLPADAPVAGGQRRPEAVLVDGGVTSNFPIDVFDRTDGRPPRWPTIGVKLSERPDAPAPVVPVRGPIGFLRALVTTVTVSGDLHLVDDPCVADRTVFVDTADVSPLAFDLDAAGRADLADRGHRAAVNWLPGFDHEGYLARCADRRDRRARRTTAGDGPPTSR
jgi:NTE family protein